ncbi:unnamed protein product [Oikopleura dioica]|uniref:Uncharacterized protein n=1 Tax=Oikopleura dioica TaxID=34765 RepID=E4XVR2_OIKDI|nr:unnamed protein product [Oikopleura dioica]
MESKKKMDWTRVYGQFVLHLAFVITLDHRNHQPCSGRGACRKLNADHGRHGELDWLCHLQDEA